MSEETTALSTMPASTVEMIDRKKTKVNETLNDAVDRIHVRLYDNNEYRAYLAATINAEAIEGKMIADDYEACRMIRDYAKKNNEVLVATKNLETIRHALGVVLRRYKMSRTERRELFSEPPHSSDDFVE
jgi:hypothetical protein